MVVAVAALAGAAIGWRFPFLGDSRTANQLNNSQDATKTQPANSTKLAIKQPIKQPASNLKATQPAATTTAQAPSSTTTAQAPNTTTTTPAPSNQPATQAPDATVNPEATQTAPTAASDANQPVPALW